MNNSNKSLLSLEVKNFLNASENQLKNSEHLLNKIMNLELSK